LVDGTGDGEIVDGKRSTIVPYQEWNLKLITAVVGGTGDV
jgi:hypothetical protein